MHRMTQVQQLNITLSIFAYVNKSNRQHHTSLLTQCNVIHNAVRLYAADNHVLDATSGHWWYRQLSSYPAVTPGLKDDSTAITM